jgi:Icc-related predicted phosphoesterase
MTMTTLRLAFVTDIHHGDDHLTKKGSAALPLLGEFSRFVAAARADAVIDMGDRISDIDKPTDTRLQREVAEAFRDVPGQRYHICGNHDLDYLTRAENEAIFGQSLAPEAIDLGPWRLVLWRADAMIRRPGGFLLTEHDVLWLAGVVRQADRPLVIVSHVPVSGHSQTGNYYFQNNPEASTYPGAERLRTVLRQARVPVVWVAGHVHWNTVTLVDGIPHLTLQSLTETFTTHPEPAAAWGLLELGEYITWQAYGRDPATFALPTAEAARRWVMPLPPFDQLPETRARRRRLEAVQQVAE